MKHLRLPIYIFGLLYPGSTFSQQTPSSSPQQTPSNFFEHMRKAKEQFDKESAPQTAADFANRGSDKLQNGDYDGAIADSSRAIELDSKMPEAYYNRGTAKLQKADYDGAIADYSKAIELNANFARAYYNRGAAKKHKGDLLGALVDDNKALKLDPNLQEQ